MLFSLFVESDPIPALTSHPNISIVALPRSPAFLQTDNKLLFLLFCAPLKVVLQVIGLWVCLAYRTRPARWLLVQNPPAIPTLAVAGLVCFLRQTRLVVDWHNFGFSLLALKLGGEQSSVVKLARWYEIRCAAAAASAHLCVTDAMGRVLRREFGIKTPVLTLRDRPAAHFQPIDDPQQRHEFLMSLPECEPVLQRERDVRVLVSSTSWTADEDFSVLIDALCRYSRCACSESPSLPSVLAIITGKGPQKERYLEQIAACEKAGELDKVTIKTAWFDSAHDYAKLLASASLGVSLHTSSSGVDLPMKVVDMFGAGLPVVGWDRFEAWPELVTEGVNGRGFGSAEQLAAHLVELFGNDATLATLREGARKESARRWEHEWDPVAGKLFGLVEGS